MNKKNIEVIVMTLGIVMFAALWINNLNKSAQEKVSASVTQSTTVNIPAHARPQALPAAPEQAPAEENAPAAPASEPETQDNVEKSNPFKVPDKFVNSIESYFVKKQEELAAKKEEIVQEIVPPREVTLPPLKLDGITKSAKGDFAIINGQIMRTGDVIEGVTIVSIKSNHVDVSYEGRPFTVNFAAETSRKEKQQEESARGGPRGFLPPNFD
jgi:hypothetical protein